jgi:hypothetical protein
LTQGQAGSLPCCEPSIPLSYRPCGTLLLRRLQSVWAQLVEWPGYQSELVIGARTER